MAMYQELHHWEDAIAIAATRVRREEEGVVISLISKTLKNWTSIDVRQFIRSHDMLDS